MRFPRLLLLGLTVVLALAAGPQRGLAQEPSARTETAGVETTLDAIVRRLRSSTAAADTGAGARADAASAETVSEQKLVDALRTASMTVEQSAALWDFLADTDNVSRATLPVVEALVAASSTPRLRDALWGELSALARLPNRKDGKQTRDRSLLGVFERHRELLRPLLGELADETEASSDDLIELMVASRVFGADIEESVSYVSGRAPAAVARHIEQERGMGRPVRWEYTAFEGMIRWKNARVVPRGAQAPRTLAELDAVGAAFITIFNCLHDLDEGYREVMLRGLGPVELFNAVVGGEQELYRLGTSGYRSFLHPMILKGIEGSGSLEAFLESAVPRWLGDEAARAAGHRAMVFVRVASSFGLIETVLEKVHDGERFIDDAIASLGDPGSFEANSLVMMDVLTQRSASPTALEFKRALLDRLYDRYRSETRREQRAAFGSMLSVYQTVTGNRHDAAIDREFALDEAVFRIPFERLFTRDRDGILLHRMFMRMDDNLDASGTYSAFRTFMASLGASVRHERRFEVFSLSAAGRRIELYANKPTPAGVRQGVADIATALRGQRVETVIGRGHTSIIPPLKADARRVLGDRLKDVVTVIVGSCGGDASVRDLIATFGYIPFVTTKSTGRQVINNAIIKAHVAALLSLAPGERLAVPEVLERGVGRYARAGVDEALRMDASFYHVNLTTVLTALLFDAHVHRPGRPGLHVAHD